jgi:hypothetical protein
LPEKGAQRIRESPLKRKRRLFLVLVRNYKPSSRDKKNH